MGIEKRNDSGQQRPIVSAQRARPREPLLRRTLERLLEYAFTRSHGGAMVMAVPASRPAVIRR